MPSFRIASLASSGLARSFTTTARRLEIRDVSELPNRIVPNYKNSPTSSLLSLEWPSPPRNVLIVPKLYAPLVISSAVEFAKHIHSEYPNLHLIFEQRIASTIHDSLPFPIYSSDPTHFPTKIDLVATLGGDGTILRAASLFSLHASVPPILSFSMGTLGFLGEWKFEEYKRAWREVYMSGSRVGVSDLQGPHTQAATNGWNDGGNDAVGTREGWATIRGKNMGTTRASKILLRHRLKVGVYDENGANINAHLMPTSTAALTQPLHPVPPEIKELSNTGEPVVPDLHAINELVIHRGPNPHLAIVDVYVGNRFLTEAVADGILISTPTGSTAYSLSAGGTIIHPLTKTMLLTPICARTLSFRHLCLPLNKKVVLKVSKKNRGRELEVSIDGKRRAGVTIGMEIRVTGEVVGQVGDDDTWTGGVPCVIRSSGQGDEGDDDDGWVGGLNERLKFNYPVG
ncbi:ATP-NAD kinase-like domain-containing protein [Pseudomassariella vexata]|uniref:ATP-NAD kinase-like domain-containing protein n=1 Tax=Pseudomassariella vexata TaxID=1141098 RepID=A0A1Y2EH95_9PEZI|nr:ATP-NAD kinase-like domain-containing protein [Pseudomassariella vexata]ORY70943.1 ATP-NAD kinase-like domain-containing protein [Pseudomassariella vexata]